MCIPKGVLDMFMACEVANLYWYVFLLFQDFILHERYKWKQHIVTNAINDNVSLFVCYFYTNCQINHKSILNLFHQLKATLLACSINYFLPL